MFFSHISIDETLQKLHSISKASRDYLSYSNNYLVLTRNSAPARKKDVEYIIDTAKFGKINDELA